MTKLLYKAGYKMYSFLRGYDGLSDPGSVFFHYDGDGGQQTLIGGLLCLGIKFTVGWIAVTKGQTMVNKSSPSVLTVESGLSPEEAEKF